MPVAKVSDINLYYEIQGSGDPLLLIMGYGMASGNWFAIRDRLAKEHRIILFDNRGTGRSDKPDMPYTTQMMAGDAAGLLDVIGVDRANVFGVSMGGMIAQEFALTYPERVRNLILGCTGCGVSKSVPPTPEAMSFLFGPELAKLPVDERALRMVPWLWNQDFIDKNPAAVKRVVTTVTEYPTPPYAYACQGNAVMTFESYDRLPQIKAPTLVICGTKDRLIPSENSKILASRIPGAELAVIENAGHGFITDSTDESAGIVLQFLQRHSKQG